MKEAVVSTSGGGRGQCLMKETEGRQFFRVLQDDPCKCAGLFHVGLLVRGRG